MSESIDNLEKAIENNVGFGTLREDELRFDEYDDLLSPLSKIQNLKKAAGKIARPVVLNGPSALVYLKLTEEEGLPIEEESEGLSMFENLEEGADAFKEGKKVEKEDEEDEDKDEDERLKGTVHDVLNPTAAIRNSEFNEWSPMAFGRRGKKGGKDIRNLPNDDIKVGLPYSRKNFPTLNKDNLTKGQKERLDQKINAYKRAVPNSKEARRTKGNERVESTPLVHYYMSRYIAAMLSVQAKEAFNLKDEQIQRISEVSEDVEELIDKAIKLAPEDETGIDRIYDIVPLETTIRFNKPTTASENNPAKVDRNTAGGTNTTEIGIIQSVYSMLTPAGKSDFRKGAAALIKTLPREKLIAGHYCVDTEILEDVFVYIEEMVLGGAKSGSNFNIFGEINSTTGNYSNESVGLNDVIAIPNWMLLAYSSDGGRAVMRNFLSIDVNFDWDERAENLMRLRDEYMDADDQESLDDLITGMRDLSEYMDYGYTQAIVVNVTDLEIQVVTTPDDEFMPDERISLKKGELLKTEMTKRMNENFKAVYEKAKTADMGIKQLEESWKHIYNPLDGEVIDDPSAGAGRFTQGSYPIFEPVLGNVMDELFVSRIVLQDQTIAAEELGEEDYGLARAFQALGNILLHIIKKNALEVGQKEKTKSTFDIAVATLLGTYRTPGPATYHAMLHHEQLYAVFAASLKQADSGGIATLGQSMVFEQYTKNPAKLMCVWSLAELGLISISTVNDKGIPQFFDTPKTDLDKKLQEQSLMNSMALIILSYYRLAFYPIRMRSRGKGAGNIDLAKNWKDLLTDAENDAPEPYAFAAVLRFLAKSKSKLKISVPTWMPTLPTDFSSIDRKRNKEEISDFLSWAYGSNPLSTEAFTEVSAAYHAAKALSYYKPGRYAEMMEAFIDAVEQERGEGFLMAVLIAYGKKDSGLKDVLEPADLTSVVTPFTQVGGFN